MSKDDYRHYAVECLLLAQELRDPAQQAVLLAMADAWSTLAGPVAPIHAVIALGMKPGEMKPGETPKS